MMKWWRLQWTKTRWVGDFGCHTAWEAKRNWVEQWYDNEFQPVLTIQAWIHFCRSKSLCLLLTCLSHTHLLLKKRYRDGVILASRKEFLIYETYLANDLTDYCEEPTLRSVCVDGNCSIYIIVFDMSILACLDTSNCTIPPVTHYVTTANSVPLYFGGRRYDPYNRHLNHSRLLLVFQSLVLKFNSRHE